MVYIQKYIAIAKYEAKSFFPAAGEINFKV